MRKSFVFVLPMLAALCLIAGCSKKDASQVVSSGVDSYSAASSGSDSEADEEEDLSEYALMNKTWIIATDTVFRPFEYTNEQGEFVGIDVDILAAVAEDQGFEYELKSLGWDAAVSSVQVGKSDALIAGATINQERKDSGWIFSDGYYNATQTFVVPADSDVSSYEDLRGKNVAVKNGTAGMAFANGLKAQYGFTITVFEDSPAMYQDVIVGNSAACCEDTPIMATNIKDGVLEMKIPEGMESEGAPYGFAIMNPKNQPLLDMFNEGLSHIRENGKYQEILDKYLK